MKVKLELFGASRDFSNKDHLELEVQDKASIDDLRNVIIEYLNKNLNGNTLTLSDDDSNPGAISITSDIGGFSDNETWVANW